MKQSHNDRAQRELAICGDRNATINLIDERHDNIIDDMTITPMTIATIVIVAAVAANLDAKDATIRKKANVWQRANPESAARATSVEQRRQKKPWA
jgi:hypothetical protein